MKIFKRSYRYIRIHLFRNYRYLFIYLFNFFNPHYVPEVKYLNSEGVVEKLRSGKSLIRIGDGEIYLMNFGSIGYQEYSTDLRKYFFEMVKEYSDESSYVLGLNKIPISKSNNQLKKDGLFHCWQPMKVFWQLYFNKDASYFDATAFYYNETFPTYFEDFLIEKDLILVTNQKNIDKFKNNPNIPFTRVTYIESPSNNAFSKHKSLLEKIHIAVNDKGKENSIVLAACGPESKVLAYVLAKDEIVTIDVGRGIEVAYTDERIDQIIYPVQK